MAKKIQKPKVSPKIGDFVLLGGTRASYPADWYLGEVRAIEGDTLFIRRSNQNGQTWFETESISHVRAIGSIGHLSAVKERARKAVAEQQAIVAGCESALGRARATLFQKLDELGDADVIPPDFDQIDAEEAAIRAAVENYDREQIEARA